MSNLIRFSLTYTFLFFTLLVNSQNNYLDKNVILENGQYTHKEILKLLSDQTGCAFSYDPTKLAEKQAITMASGSYTLQKALQKILPANIQYKMNGKYVVLLKKTVSNQTTINRDPTFIKSVSKYVETENKVNTNLLTDSVIQTIEEKPDTSTITIKDTLVSQPKDSEFKPDTTTVVNQETPEILNDTAIVDTDTKTSENSNSKSKIKPKSIIELELAADNHLGTISTHFGLSVIYGIISTGTDYNKSYHLGIGVGTGFKIYKNLGMNIELTQYTLTAGRSRRLNIKAYTTQISPTLNYILGQHWKISLGPTFYNINSSYNNGSTSSALGKYNGYSGLVGVNYNFQGY